MAGQAQLEVVVGELLDEALAPFDQGHRVLEGGVEVEGVDLADGILDVAEPVRVDVHHRDAAGGGGTVDPGDHERR